MDGGDVFFYIDCSFPQPLLVTQVSCAKQADHSTVYYSLEDTHT